MAPQFTAARPTTVAFTSSRPSTPRAGYKLERGRLSVAGRNVREAGGLDSVVLVSQSGRCSCCSMHLGCRRWREADENYDAITTWIHADSVDVEIGFPVVNEPKIAGLIYVNLGATHHWDEAWRPWWLPITVQRHAIMQ